MPKVSIVMTLYNCAEHIGEAIESALAQTYQDREIFLIDDGSTDGSAAVVHKFGHAVRYVYQQNRGAAHATNRGVASPSGEYIAFLENDDAWLPTKLERQVAILDGSEGIGVVTSDLRYFTEKSEPENDFIRGYRPEEPFSRIFLKGFNYTLSAIMVRRRVFESTGGFDEGFQAAGLQDVEWYPRLMDVTEGHYIAEPLSYFRRHDMRIPDNVMLRNNEYMLDRLWDRFKDDPRKARYILGQRVAFLSQRGKRRIEQGLVRQGQDDLVAAILLALKRRVAGKMVFRSALRLARSYLAREGSPTP